jgi:hypothetical protein
LDSSFEDSSVSPEQVFMDYFTIVTEENSGRFGAKTS